MVTGKSSSRKHGTYRAQGSVAIPTPALRGLKPLTSTLRIQNRKLNCCERQTATFSAGLCGSRSMRTTIKSNSAAPGHGEVSALSNETTKNCPGLYSRLLRNFSPSPELSMVIVSSNHGTCSGRTRTGTASRWRTHPRRSSSRLMTIAISIQVPAWRNFKTQRSHPRVMAIRRMQCRGGHQSVRRHGSFGPAQPAGIAVHCACTAVSIHAFGHIFHRRRAHHLRRNFRLPIRNRRVVRKRDPQQHSFRVRLLAWHQQAATRNVHSFANLGFLAEGRRPAESRGKPELDAVMLASVHKLLQ